MSKLDSRAKIAPSALLLATLLCRIAAGAAVAPGGIPPFHVGQPLQDALHELRSGGVRLLYSNQLVPASLRIEQLPSGGTPLEVARQLLAQHRLRLTPGPQGRWLVASALPEAAAGSPVADTPASTGAAPLQEITVVASRYQLMPDSPATFLTKETIARTPHIADDPFRVIRQLPGITGGDFSAGLHIRGGARDEVATLVDGVVLYDPFHMKDLQGALGMIDEGILDSIEVLPGGFGAEYGGRMSGVVAMRTVQPADTTQTALGVSFVNAFARRQGPLANGGGHYLVAVRRGYLDWLFKLIDSDGDFTPRYWDAYAKVDWTVGDATVLAANALVGSDDLRYVDAASRKSDLSVGGARSQYGWLQSSTQWSESVSSDTVLSFSHVTRHRQNEQREPGFAAAVDDVREFSQWTLRSDWHWAIADRTIWSAGIETRDGSADYDYQLDRCVAQPFPSGVCIAAATRAADFTVDGESWSAYASLKRRLGARLTAEAGIRGDRQTRAGFAESQWSPRMSLRWDVGTQSSLRISVGRYSQPQGVEEIAVEDGEHELHRAERADQAILAFEQQLPGVATLHAEAYVKNYSLQRTRYENQFDPFEVVPEARPDRIVLSPLDGRVHGAELTLSNRSDQRLTWRASYAWQQAEDRFASGWVRRSWDQTHAVSTTIGWRYGQWDIGLFATWHSGWPTTALDFDVTQTADGLTLTPIVGARNARHYSPYGRLDLRASRTRQLRSGDLTYFFELYNATARNNECCVGDISVIQRPDGSLGTRIEHDRWLPLLPSFGFTWTLP